MQVTPKQTNICLHHDLYHDDDDDHDDDNDDNNDDDNDDKERKEVGLGIRARSA